VVWIIMWFFGLLPGVREEEALDRIKWRNRFGRGCGPVVWQITDDDDDDDDDVDVDTRRVVFVGRPRIWEPTGVPKRRPVHTTHNPRNHNYFGMLFRFLYQKCLERSKHVRRENWCLWTMRSQRGPTE
jgi:hypothetical protein